ncbi:MAG: autotransporter outer membrane beta-barrel domain-containing protein [Snodgrassella sp.]|nr:autotransporter outer membrane beta-barrel domain-containing protein [Snodgrassella sp.]
MNIYTDVKDDQTDKLVVTGNTTGTTNINIVEIDNSEIEKGCIEDIISVGGNDDAIWTIKEKADSAFDYTIGRDTDGKLIIEYTNAFSNVRFDIC